MNAIIIEDEGIAAKRLATMLTSLRPEINILAQLDSVESSVQWFENNPSPDLVFLDIQLLDGLSFEIFQHVKIDSMVIFTTAFDEYAIRAFELNCIDYLLKPISPEKLKLALDKIDKYQHLFSSKGLQDQIAGLLETFSVKKTTYRSRFLVAKPDGYVPVFEDEIAYFLAHDDTVKLVTHNNDMHPLDKTLENLQEELNPEKFWRANRAFIVSAKSIVKVHNYFNYKIKLQLKPAAQKDVIVSRAKVGDFKKWFV